jgi:hypothetical protein
VRGIAVLKAFLGNLGNFAGTLNESERIFSHASLTVLKPGGSGVVQPPFRA